MMIFVFSVKVAFVESNIKTFFRPFLYHLKERNPPEVGKSEQKPVAIKKVYNSYETFIKDVRIV